MTKTSLKVGERNRLVDATPHVLTLQIAGRTLSVPWSSVAGIRAGRAKLSHSLDQRTRVLAVEIEVDGVERCYIVTETELAWETFIAMMSKVLPNIAALAQWRSELDTASGPLDLYPKSDKC